MSNRHKKEQQTNQRILACWVEGRGIGLFEDNYNGE